jgi:hypothetical protein
VEDAPAAQSDAAVKLAILAKPATRCRIETSLANSEQGVEAPVHVPQAVSLKGAGRNVD